MWEMIPIILSVGLFVLTLIIIFTLRKADRQNRRLDIMRQYVGQYISEVKNAESRLHELITDVESRLDKNRRGTEELVSQIMRERESLFSHNEDLEELQKTLAYYHEVLGQLGAMTEKAEMRTRQVRSEVQKVEAVNRTIEESLALSAETEKQLNHIQQQVDHSLDTHVQRLATQMEQSVSDAKQRVDSLLDDSLNHTDATFQTMITTVQAFLRELNNRTEILEGVVKRLTDVSLESMDTVSKQIEETKALLSERDQVLRDLAERRDTLERSVATLGERKIQLAQEISNSEDELAARGDELKQINDELDLALAERQRLIEEEEQRELELRARLDDPDLLEDEVESEEIVPPFYPEETVAPVEEDEDPEADETIPLFDPEKVVNETMERNESMNEEDPEDESDHKEKRKRIESDHFEPEEDEEEIVLDDDDAEYDPDDKD
jgi:ABC-type transporter Mla subunit MlaD